MTYTTNQPHCGGVYRDGVAIAFTRGDDLDAPKEADRIANALRLVEQIARMTVTGETDCPPGVEEGASEALDALVIEARQIANGAPCNTPPPPPDEYLGSFEYELIADALDCLDPDGSAATNRAQELAAWARAMAATGRGYLPPSQGEPLRVLVALEGGCVSAVIINRPGVELITLDYDTEGSDEADLFDIPQDGGDTAQAWRTIGECEHDQGDFFERARDARPSDPEGRLAMLRSNAASLGEAVEQSDYGRGLQREIAELERELASKEAEATA